MENKRRTKRENQLLAAAAAGILAMILAAATNYYYALNDDVLIKDILSGVYTGKPEAHTMQLLYPLALGLTVCYRLFQLPCFGLFLLLCQFGSLWVFGYRSLCAADRLWETDGGFGRTQAAAAKTAKEGKTQAAGGTGRSRMAWGWKTVLVGAVTLFLGGVFLKQLVFVQYTTAAGMLGCAGIFWFLTGERRPEEGTAAFLKEQIPAVGMVVTAFCLRSEMMLLLLPLAGVAGLCRWGLERPAMTRRNAAGYVSLFGLLAVGCGLCLGMDALAYRSQAWQTFQRFFDARTEVYDYHMDVVTEYEANRAFYESAGISPETFRLLETYNFGVSDAIDTACLEEIAAYANEKDGGGLFVKTPQEAVWDWKERLLGRTDAPLGALVTVTGVWTVLLSVLAAVRSRRSGEGRVGSPGKLLWQMPLAAGAGSVLWLFILLRGRYPERITWPLYLGQLTVAVGLWYRYGVLAAEMAGDGQAERSGTGQAERDSDGQTESAHRSLSPAVRRLAGCVRKRAAGVVLPAGLALLAVSGLLCLPGNWRAVKEEQLERERRNACNEAVMAYCEAHPQQLFLADVYATVGFSEKIWQKQPEGMGNYDLLGGWLNKSPLTEQKLAQFGFASMEEAVTQGGGRVRILAESGSDMSWLEQWLAAEAGSRTAEPEGQSSETGSRTAEPEGQDAEAGKQQFALVPVDRICPEESAGEGRKDSEATQCMTVYEVIVREEGGQQLWKAE